MPTYDIQTPGGKVLTIEAPDEANALAGARHWHAQQPAQFEYDGGGGIGEGVSTVARALNKNLTDFVGAPGDLMDLAAVPIARRLGLVDQDREHIFGGFGTTARRGLDAAAHAAGLPADAKMAYERKTELPPDMRPLAAAGEALGSAIPLMGLIGGSARAVNLAAGAAPAAGNVVASAARDLTRHAAQNPGTWAAGELAAVQGGAQGAAIGQALDNDGETGAAVGQLAGSLVNPVGTIVGAAKGLKNAGTGAASLFSKGAAEERAAQHLSKLLNEAGEDAGAITKNIEAGAADPLAAPFSAADRSNSPTLLGLQSRIAGDSPDFGKQLATQREQGFANLRGTADGELGGDPAALTRVASEVRDANDARRVAFVDRAHEQRDGRVAAIESDVNRFVGAAQDAAGEAAARFPRDAEVRNNASGAARETLDTAYAADRAREGELWRGLDLTQRVPVPGFKAALGEIKGRMVPGESLPPVAEAAARYLGNPRLKSVTAEVVQGYRSRLLTLARDASSGATPDRNAAGIYRTLADGLLEDLAPVAGADEARAFSRALNDRWSRTYAGETQRVTGTGAQKVGEMSTLSRALTGSDAERAGNLAALRDAAGDAGPAMRAQQETYLRQHAAERIVDPLTGAVDPAKAARYQADHATVLTAFPELNRDLTSAVTTGRNLRAAIPAVRDGAAAAVRDADSFLSGAVSDANRTARVLNDRSAFGQVLKAGERPERAVSSALTGANPARDLRGLAALAKSGGDDAVAGLRSAALDHTFAQAGKQARQAGGFWHAVGQQLDAPIATGKPTLMDALTGNRVLTATGKARLAQIVQRGKAIEAADATGRHIREAGPATDMFVDQIIRTAGANYGAGISVFGHSGATLSAASYGSRVFRKLFEDMPSQKAVDVLQKALGDDVLMRKLLSKVTPAKEPGVIDALKRELGDVVAGRKSVAAGAKGALGEARAAAPPVQLRYRPKAATMGAYLGLLGGGAQEQGGLLSP